ncbi:uncharacterized protein LOC127123515 [Lathyrus oleraceus]|uniref:uncharacterized protein LOC127123515 n=1 Tax=Pisum sativum TaxID=3888 RepID=UPI0021D3D6A8|nr:uncharacterized protein LOC127123515 [Pisum sativum]
MEHVLTEIGFPRTFVNWIILAVTSVTYQFNINDTYTKTMEGRHGLRQGDPVSPLLFVIMMEYLNKCFKRLKNNPNFNFHSKCEKLNITNLCFANDLLLFARGDVEFVRLMMTAYNVFSLSTRLKFNPAKCCIFFGGVNQIVRNDIKNLTGFAEGNLPFCYLGIPMSSKRLSAQAYDNLIDKIMGKINHWNSRFLFYAGMLLLNTVTLLKLLWNLSGKADSLWERWIHTYYVKIKNIMDIGMTTNA